VAAASACGRPVPRCPPSDHDRRSRLVAVCDREDKASADGVRASRYRAEEAEPNPCTSTPVLHNAVEGAPLRASQNNMFSRRSVRPGLHGRHTHRRISPRWMRGRSPRPSPRSRRADPPTPACRGSSRPLGWRPPTRRGRTAR